MKSGHFTNFPKFTTVQVLNITVAKNMVWQNKSSQGLLLRNKQHTFLHARLVTSLHGSTKHGPKTRWQATSDWTEPDPSGSSLQQPSPSTQTTFLHYPPYSMPEPTVPFPAQFHTQQQPYTPYPAAPLQQGNPGTYLPMPSSLPLPMVPPLTYTRPTSSNLNRVKLTGIALNLQDVSGVGPVPHAALTLQTNTMGACLIQLLDTVARQAHQYLQPGMRVAVTGQLAVGNGGQLYIQGQQIQLVMEQTMPTPGGEGTGSSNSGRSKGPGRNFTSLTSDSNAVLRALREGKSEHEILAMTEMQGISERLVRNLVDVCCEGRSDIDPKELVPLAFRNTGYGECMAVDEMTSFIEGYLQQPSFPLTSDGLPKLTPIREALLRNSDLSHKVLAQEEVENGKSVTFHQIKLALAILGK
ncbi:hypothetical protein CEUSTIGMA_g10949.t1 [Chlamydomonas eustigma]|uniref:Uncharacterized protein n=1 Tax=Chlamydomonas eustigma TaxID=1157962 RepID=A0A250XKC6_9CHLO|nr:hypothetical protein CEUSTIGMA_g10949.t1 [Chlamydomonas eustigma]|eukprot:GAX83524.1 hypothetical protein CEUSTIGMA_g10949.t1 [Chlamydomonas eustigma]